MKIRIALFFMFCVTLIIIEGLTCRKLGINSAWQDGLTDFQYALYLIGIFSLIAFNYLIITFVGNKLLK